MCILLAVYFFSGCRLGNYFFFAGLAVACLVVAVELYA